MSNTDAPGNPTQRAPALPALPLRNWLMEREENALRIARGKRGSDRDGWLEDAAYFRAAYMALDTPHATALSTDDPLDAATTSHEPMTHFACAICFGREEDCTCGAGGDAKKALDQDAAKEPPVSPDPVAWINAKNLQRLRQNDEQGLFSTNVMYGQTSFFDTPLYARAALPAGWVPFDRLALAELLIVDAIPFDLRQKIKAALAAPDVHDGAER